MLTETGFIPTHGTKFDKKDLHLASKHIEIKIWKYSLREDRFKRVIKQKKGDVLEIGAQCAIANGDIPAFERYMTQLKTFYFDFE